MAKAAPKKTEKEEKKAPSKVVEKETEKVVEKEIVEEKVASTDDEAKTQSPRMVVESEDQGNEQQEAVADENVGSQIESADNQAVTVRKNVSSPRLFFFALFVGVVLGALLFGGLIAYEHYGGGSLPKLSFGLPTTPTATPTEAPVTPSPTEAAPDFSEYSVQVLNGSGVAGVASDVSDLLIEAGFAGIDTGNADAYDYEDTEVAMKSSVPTSVFDAIEKALPSYTVVEVTALPDDSEYDIVVTVGQQATSSTEDEEEATEEE